MDERTITRALLGDREAQERLTAEGVLLPCGHCGGKADYAKKKEDWLSVGFSTVGVQVYCTICRVGTQYNKTENEARKEWNHRAPLLTPTQMEALERMEDSHDE